MTELRAREADVGEKGGKFERLAAAIEAKAVEF
jgi:hypothetical protein